MSEQILRPRDVYMKRRQELEAELLAAQPDVMKEYLGVVAALVSMGAYWEDGVPSQIEYLDVRMPRDVAVLILEKRGLPMGREEIGAIAAAGGFRRDAKYPHLLVTSAIDSDLARNSRRLFFVTETGAIGLAKWLEPPPEV